MKCIDLSGKRFGRLLVISRNGKTNDGRAAWLCRCDCGTEKVVSSSYLIKGETMSCGCLNKEINRKRQLTHGMTKTRLYREWRGIKSRCNKERDANYPRYGGRGITVCQEWLDSFEAFRDWALANGYQDDLTIDRIDNDGPYSPENCRWKSRQEQQRNRSNNRQITHNGITKTMAQWAEENNIPYSTFRRRLDKGWHIEDAITKPVRKKTRTICNEKGN